MGSLCKYAESVGCKQCTSVVYARCKQFASAHRKYLISDLAPFNFKFDPAYRPYHKGKVVYVNGTQPQLIAKLKSAAVNFSLEHNVRIKRLSMQKVLNRIIPKSSEDTDWVNEAKAYFLDLDRLSLKGKDEELRSVIFSFISICEDNNIHVFMASRYAVEDPSWVKVSL